MKVGDSRRQAFRPPWLSEYHRDKVSDTSPYARTIDWWGEPHFSNAMDKLCSTNIFKDVTWRTGIQEKLVFYIIAGLIVEYRSESHMSESVLTRYEIDPSLLLRSRRHLTSAETLAEGRYGKLSELAAEAVSNTKRYQALLRAGFYKPSARNRECLKHLLLELYGVLRHVVERRGKGRTLAKQLWGGIIPDILRIEGIRPSKSGGLNPPAIKKLIDLSGGTKAADSRARKLLERVPELSTSAASPPEPYLRTIPASPLRTGRRRTAQ